MSGPRGGPSENRVRLAPLFRRPLRTFPPLGSPMTANRVQASLAQQLAASTSPRRRSVPPSLPEPMSQSLHQRWRERPRCPALRVAPAPGDGVVHAIAGRAVCHVSVQRVRQEETRRPPACVRGRVSPDNPPDKSRAHWHDAQPLLPDPRDDTPHQLCACTIARLILVPCSASSMLFAALRPGRKAGPAGIDDACARHDCGLLRDGRFLMARASSGVRREGVDAGFPQAYVDVSRLCPTGTSSASHPVHAERVSSRRPQGTIQTHPTTSRLAVPLSRCVGRAVT